MIKSSLTSKRSLPIVKTSGFTNLCLPSLESLKLALGNSCFAGFQNKSNTVVLLLKARLDIAAAEAGALAFR